MGPQDPVGIWFPREAEDGILSDNTQGGLPPSADDFMYQDRG